jgi:hypothetical protein
MSRQVAGHALELRAINPSAVTRVDLDEDGDLDGEEEF